MTTPMTPPESDRACTWWSAAWRSACASLALAGGLALVDVGYGAVGAAAELTDLDPPVRP